MQRREFIGLMGSAAVWPVVALAQQPGKIPVVSILWHGTKEKELAHPFYHWVVEGFESAGLKPGVNVILDHEFADESDAKYNQLAPEMVARRPAVLVAIALPPTLALMKVQGDIPLVFLGSPDPVLLGLGDSLARRSKPVTGITSMGADLSAKRLQLLKTAVPSSSRVALLVNPKTRSTAENDIKQYSEAAKRFGVTVQHFEIAEYNQVGPAFVQLTKWKADGVITSQAPLFALIREELADAALAAKLPLMAFSETLVDKGALMSYGSSLRDLFLSGGPLVKRVLAGERPSEIPIMNPTKFELVVNMKTAAALGLTFPLPFLGAIDRMVE
ncbi:MAG: ABC transporter substrate-binding protein [Reyranellaceae bacterium]